MASSQAWATPLLGTLPIMPAVDSCAHRILTIGYSMDTARQFRTGKYNSFLQYFYKLTHLLRFMVELSLQIGKCFSGRLWNHLHLGNSPWFGCMSETGWKNEGWLIFNTETGHQDSFPSRWYPSIPCICLASVRINVRISFTGRSYFLLLLFFFFSYVFLSTWNGHLHL